MKTAVWRRARTSQDKNDDNNHIIFLAIKQKLINFLSVIYLQLKDFIQIIYMVEDREASGFIIKNVLFY